MMSRSLFCAALFVAATSSLVIEEPEVHFPVLAPPPPPGPPGPPAPPCGFPPPPPPPPPPHGPYGPPFVAEAVVADDCDTSDTATILRRQVCDPVAHTTGSTFVAQPAVHAAVDDVNYAVTDGESDCDDDGSIAEDVITGTAVVKQAYVSSVRTATGVPAAVVTGTGTTVVPTCEDNLLVKRGIQYKKGLAPSGYAAYSGYAAETEYKIVYPEATAYTRTEYTRGYAAPTGTGCAVSEYAPTGTRPAYSTGTSGPIHKDHDPIDHLANGDRYLNRRAPVGTAAPSGCPLEAARYAGHGSAVSAGYVPTGFVKIPASGYVASGYVPTGTAPAYSTGTSGPIHKDHDPIDHVANGDHYINRRALTGYTPCGAVLSTGTALPVAHAVARETLLVEKEPCGCPTYGKLLGRACPHTVTTGTAVQAVQPVAVSETAFVATGTASLMGVYKAYATGAPTVQYPTGATTRCGCPPARILARQCEHTVPVAYGTGSGYATGAVYSASTTFGGVFTGTGTVIPAVPTVAPVDVKVIHAAAHADGCGCPSSFKLLGRACPQVAAATGDLHADPPVRIGTGYATGTAAAVTGYTTGTAIVHDVYSDAAAYKVVSTDTGCSFAASTGLLKAEISPPYPSGELVGTACPEGTAAERIVHGPTASAIAVANAISPCEQRHTLYRRVDTDSTAEDSSDSDSGEQNATEDAESGAGRISGGLFGVAMAIAATVALM